MERENQMDESALSNNDNKYQRNENLAYDQDKIPTFANVSRSGSPDFN
jgi:hypothetical protein